MKRTITAFVLLFFYSVLASGNAYDDLNAAYTEIADGHFSTAIPLFESGFKKIESGDTVPHQDILSAKIGLATAYMATGGMNKALALAEPLLPELKENGPRDVYAGCVEVLYYIHFLKGEDEQALKKLQVLISLQKELPKYFSLEKQILILSQQALIQDRSGDTLNAIYSQQQLIELYKQDLPNSLNELLVAYAVLISYSEKINQHTTALQGLKDKLALMLPHEKNYQDNIYKTRVRIKAIEKRLAQQGPDVDNPYGTDWAELFAKQESYDVISIQNNLIKVINTFGEASPLAATGFMQYGDTLAAIGQTDYALQVYDIAHAKLVALYGENSPNLAELYLNRGKARKYSVSFEQDMTGDVRSKMIADYQRSINIYAELYGDAHPKTIAALRALYNSEQYKNNYALIYKIAKRLFTAYSEYEKSSFTYLDRKQKLAFRERYKDLAQRFIEASWLLQAPNTEDWGNDTYPALDFSKPDWKAIHDKEVAAYNKRNTEKKEKKQRALAEAFEIWVNHKGSINAVDNTLTLVRQNTLDADLRDRIDSFFAASEKLTMLATNNRDWKALQIERKRLQILISGLLKKLSIDIPELRLDNRVTLKDLKKKIPKKSIYLDFIKLYTYQYAVFSYDANGEVRLSRLGDDSVSIEQRVKKIRSLINDTIDGDIAASRSERLLKKELAELYNKIIGQIPGVIDGYNELIISADGLLALMPMGLLYDDKNKQYLIEKFAIRTIPSARILIKQKNNKQTKLNNAVIFADPDFDLGVGKEKLACAKESSSRSLTLSVLKNFDKPCIGRLPATATEAKSINAILKNTGKTFLQSQATEKSLLKQKSPGILHIATHGFFLPDPAITNPLEKSGLILSGANAGIADKTGKGVVTGLKLASMDLNNTELVVLSACETGVGDIEQGEGVAGLNQAFLRAGAKGVVMSLWRVPDAQTAELMKRLYGEIDKGISPVEALREAQRSFIKDGQHPLAWAAFAYSG
ncbi:MAG: CHAT domain-containing protein [Sulfuriflexus sp.]|nr:CHAT domain-containing protein [Sulfuriflexus sp.]